MLAAVVILYNPNNSILENIDTYIDSVSLVYVIDNSNCSNENIFSNSTSKSKIKYIFNNGNLGIATALNIGCQMAIKEGMQWVLTMDQDSKFSSNCSEVFSLAIKNATKTIALYYPNYIIGGEIYDKYIIENDQPIVVMTSGNLLNLEAYQKVNGFEDKLFIDYVDVDYCLKLKQSGYKIVNLPSANLVHELGQSVLISFLNLKMIVTNHSNLRRYYITRNRLFVMKKYQQLSKIFDKIERKVFVNDIIKILFFEQNKFSKIKSIIKGYLDYRNNKFGVYKE